MKSALLTSLPTSRPLVSPSCHSRCGSTLKPQSPGDGHSLPRQRSQKLEVPISPTTLISPLRFHIPLAATLVPLVSSKAPYYPHHDQESHASRPRIPHCTPWSSFLISPQHSALQILPPFCHMTRTCLLACFAEPVYKLPGLVSGSVPLYIASFPKNILPKNSGKNESLLWVSLTSGQFTSTWPLLSAILSPTSEIIPSTQQG